MFSQFLCLNIFCSKTPCELTILTCNGFVIKRLTLNKSCSKVCVCTKEKNIKLQAKNESQTIYQEIKICNFLFQNIFVSFGFHAILPARINTFITLHDKNYGFPVDKAILKFEFSN